MGKSSQWSNLTCEMMNRWGICGKSIRVQSQSVTSQRVMTTTSLGSSRQCSSTLWITPQSVRRVISLTRRCNGVEEDSKEGMDLIELKFYSYVSLLGLLFIDENNRSQVFCSDARAHTVSIADYCMMFNNFFFPNQGRRENVLSFIKERNSQNHFSFVIVDFLKKTAYLT